MGSTGQGAVDFFVNEIGRHVEAFHGEQLLQANDSCVWPNGRIRFITGCCCVVDDEQHFAEGHSLKGCSYIVVEKSVCEVFAGIEFEAEPVEYDEVEVGVTGRIDSPFRISFGSLRVGLTEMMRGLGCQDDHGQIPMSNVAVLVRHLDGHRLENVHVLLVQVQTARPQPMA